MHIYFMGVCGTAMGNAALLMRECGHTVSGSDTGIYPPMSTTLQAAGVEILEGYDPGRLARLAPDLVVIGNAQSRGNVEVEWLLESRALPWVSLPELLNRTILGTRRNIVISGTHGKTTTTALTAHLLRSTGLKPGWLVGGVPRDLPGGAHLGDPTAPFVIEGDEYDSAFFDKRSKFIHYNPFILVINNIEFDHADIFRDLADVQRTFAHVTRLVPRNGWVLANGDDANIAPLLALPWTRVLRVGTGENCDLRILGFNEDSLGSRFRLGWQGRELPVAWGLSGIYNARNAAMAALAAAMATHDGDLASLPLEDLVPHLAGFLGVRRRQELRHASPALLVVEDFGHHPTALAHTLEGLRRRHPGHRIAAAFEPRSNTAMSNVFQAEFTEALGLADATVLGPVHRAGKLAAGLRLDTDALAAELRARGRFAQACADNETVFSSLMRMSRSADDPLLVCFFSNGAFGGIIERFVAAQKTAGEEVEEE